MKKNQFVKFGLTVVAAAVLAACSSSSSDDSAAKQAAAAQQAQAEKAAAEKAAAEKAAAEKAAAEKAAAEKAVAEKAAAEKAAKEAEEKAANAFVNRQGGKFVKKTVSDLEIGLNEGKKTSTSQGEVVDMNIKLHRSLDTLVVASNTAKTGSTDKIGYLEDYDFRKESQEELDTARATGKTTLSHIYKDTTNTKGGATRTQVSGEKVIATSANAMVEESIRIRNNTEDTKTKTMGTNTGNALVYQEGRNIYIGKDETVKAGNTDKYLKKDGELNDFRDRSSTVTEVYGHRIFVVGNSETGVDIAADTNSNAPFQNLTGNQAGTGYTAGTLNKVQYGRVTSALDTDRGLNAKEGIKTGDVGTLAVGYADYNDGHSENNYFYRGVDATAKSDTLLSDLSNYYGKVGNVNEKAGSLSYQGHALTYGFTHTAPDADLPEKGVVPNAVYSQADYVRPTLISGTHVSANIDLATRDVTGNLYDVWAFEGVKEGDKTNYISKDIATFEGKLANSGEINGTSTRTQDKAAGTLSANLYGTKAEELGGAVASTKTDAANSWGAVFGATVQNAKYVEPVKVVETKPVVEKPVVEKPVVIVSPWSSTTDQVNLK